MRQPLFISLFVFLGLIGYAQDRIFMRDSTILYGKVTEVGLDKIKYTKAELPQGPSYEILKSDVIKLVYRSGYTEVISVANLSKEDQKVVNSYRDTCNYSKIFILFKGKSDQVFPCYFNNELIWTMKSLSRLEYKVYSEGEIEIYRYSNKSYVKDGPTKGPTIKLNVRHGQFYGLKITLPYPQALNPNKRFEIIAISDRDEFLRFLKEEYYGFTPYKNLEFIGQEDTNKQIIQKEH
jgi:hypothetical protein